MATLVLITSFSLYLYIRFNSNSQIQNQLQKQAQFLLKDRDALKEKIKNNIDLLKNSIDITAKVEKASFMNYRPKFFRTIKIKDKYYIQGFFPYNFQNQEYLILTKDITKDIKFEKKLYKAIIFINLISLVVIIFYAFILSKMLIKPIRYFSSNIAKMNEKKLAN
jgi:two-component system OmpR family sensor kinase